MIVSVPSLILTQTLPERSVPLCVFSHHSVPTIGLMHSLHFQPGAATICLRSCTPWMQAAVRHGLHAIYRVKDKYARRMFIYKCRARDASVRENLLCTPHSCVTFTPAITSSPSPPAQLHALYPPVVPDILISVVLKITLRYLCHREAATVAHLHFGLLKRLRYRIVDRHCRCHRASLSFLSLGFSRFLFVNSSSSQKRTLLLLISDGRQTQRALDRVCV